MEPLESNTALRELHAATLAVIINTECPALRDTCNTYWTRVVDKHFQDADSMQHLQAYLDDVTERAERQAAEMHESIPAMMLRTLCNDDHIPQ